MEKTYISSFALLFLFCCVSVADKVPVLLWSPTRPLSDLPPTYAGNSIDSSSFHQKYIAPLTSKPGQNLVAFIQDKLSLEDFTKHADVYNPFSDGGAFKNVKGFMDDHFSADLPSVHSPHSVLDLLKKDFVGKIHQVTSPSELSKLSLNKDESYLILVTLPAIQGAADEGKAFSKNDELIAEVIKQLGKMAIQYTAMYTAKRSKRDVKSETAHRGRHLLATEGGNKSYIFVNYTNQIYFYARGIKLDIMRGRTSVEMLNLPTAPDKYSDNGTEVMNNTAVFQLSFQSVTPLNKTEEYNVSFRFELKTHAMAWSLQNLTVSVDSANQSNSVKDLLMNVRELYMDLPVKFSYHCSLMTLTSIDKNGTYVKITFNGFQFQPFRSKGNRFGDGWDCVGYFTTPILMGLLPVAMLVFILFCGMYMLAGLSTMDRFDDPKGKTVNVNVQE
ncbi:V-type proton ATPase subunit S1-like [Gigantopelta aegis]|uniref:V-type proton ATPase subunit S1-like n=1 Tax=Gigantopelta aegis TaxID=1735272 RepID=UPI001B88A821|nr:V-type proton ATPase subunit S1-like [Gigantopelta aegis]